MPPLTAPREAAAASASSAHGTAASNIITQHTLNLSLPYPPNADPLVDSASYHLLLAEMPSVLAHSSRRAALRRERLLGDLREAGQSPTRPASTSPSQETQRELEARLEQVGAQVGASLAERLSRDRPPLPTTLDVLKFLCKDFWIAIWDKQVDGLRTNHRGVYVLQDHAFKPLIRIASSEGSATTARIAQAQLAHSIGLLRGALGRMGVSATVVAESALSQGNSIGGVAAPAAGGSGPASSPAATTFHVRISNAGTSTGSAGAAVGQPSGHT
ncbi:unnamed protein product [Parajaminaea phylloscopi]